MKILQICAYAAPYAGNFMKSLSALEIEARKDGFETIYCFPDKNKDIDWCKELERNHIVYYVPLAKARIKLKTYRTLRKIFKEHPDIVYAHSHFELYDTPLAITAPVDVKVFWHLHDAIGNYLHGIYRLVWKAHYTLFSRRAKLLSVSQKHMQVAIKLGFNASNAYYEPNAIDTERIRQVSKVTEKKFDFIIYGWDYIRKGVDLAIVSVKNIGNDIKLGVVGGSVNEEYSPGNYDIKNISPAKDVNVLLDSTKCFLHISRAEGLSYALLEALYSGLPVIVSDIEENMIATEFPTAIMVKNNNVHEISDAIRKIKNGEIIFSNDDIHKSFKLIEEKYSIASWAQRILHDYKTL